MEFNSESMTMLGDHPSLKPGYNDLGLEDLNSIIESYKAAGMDEGDMGEIFNTANLFGITLASIGVTDYEKVLSVKVGEGGVIERVYGPSIKQNSEGELICQCGSNEMPVVLGDKVATIGQWIGDIEISDKKSESGEAYITVSWSHIIEDEVIEIPFIFDKNNRPTKVAFKRAQTKHDIAQFLMVAGQGNWTDVRTMEIGEYRVLGIEENELHPEYGRSWTIALDGIGDIKSRGQAMESALKTKTALYKKMLDQGKPVTFNLADLIDVSKNKTGDKIRVVASFFLREPNPNKMVAGNKQAALKSAEPVEHEQRELVGAGATVDAQAISF